MQAWHRIAGKDKRKEKKRENVGGMSLPQHVQSIHSSPHPKSPVQFVIPAKKRKPAHPLTSPLATVLFDSSSWRGEASGAQGALCIQDRGVGPALPPYRNQTRMYLGTCPLCMVWA